MDEKIIQTAAAILYPNKIIVETRNITGQGSYYSTDDLTILPVDSSLEVLGRAISAHLSRSKLVRPDSVNYREERKKYFKKGKFKSEQDFRKDARYVAIFRVKSFLNFHPKENQASKGKQGSLLLGMRNEIFQIEDSNDYIDIGTAIKQAWAKCIFT
jgi:hypothetical protein